MGNRTNRKKKTVADAPKMKGIREQVLEDLQRDRIRCVSELERSYASGHTKDFQPKLLLNIRTLEARISELSGQPLDNWQFAAGAEN